MKKKEKKALNYNIVQLDLKSVWSSNREGQRPLVFLCLVSAVCLQILQFLQLDWMPPLDVCATADEVPRRIYANRASKCLSLAFQTLSYYNNILVNIVSSIAFCVFQCSPHDAHGRWYLDISKMCFLCTIIHDGSTLHCCHAVRFSMHLWLKMKRDRKKTTAIIMKPNALTNTFTLTRTFHFF